MVRLTPHIISGTQYNGITLILGGLIGFGVVLDQFQAVLAQPGLSGEHLTLVTV